MAITNATGKQILHIGYTKVNHGTDHDRYTVARDCILCCDSKHRDMKINAYYFLDCHNESTCQTFRRGARRRYFGVCDPASPQARSDTR